MRCLVVHAHPLPASLTRHFCDLARTALAANGHDIHFLDLYAVGFDPRLTAQERASHYEPVYDTSLIGAEAAELRAAEMLVLVFPTWWFGLPAILKGWIDRTFAPGVAFGHRADFGPIKPLLTNLRRVVVITTLGSPWWADWLVMRRPVRRMLKTAVTGACAPQARFSYLAFYGADKPSPQRVAAFAESLTKALSRL